jgi:hypothetical protein
LLFMAYHDRIIWISNSNVSEEIFLDKISLFKSEDMEQTYKNTYEEALRLWPIPYERLYIETKHGITHIDWHDWTHTVSNAMIVCIGLLFGDMDFEKSISIAVLGAFDTDCNGSTTGSILGMALGAKAMPEKWTAPLNDLLRTGVSGYELLKISDLAARTMSIIEKVRGR